MKHLTSRIETSGPWSLAASKRFWKGFTPAALGAQSGAADELFTVFRVEGDWSRAEAEVGQSGRTARIRVSGDGDLHAAAAQVARMLSLDVDAVEWPAVGDRDPVIADAQRRLPGLRPCGFHSPYEAAACAVLSQRVRMEQASRLRQDLVTAHGDDGAFPSPETLRKAELHLPGRKAEYLRAVADAALDGLLDGASLRSVDSGEAISRVQDIKGLGPFAAKLVVLRGASAPDAMPGHERRLATQMTELYGPDRSVADITDAWRPYRTWAAFHLRVLAEQPSGRAEAGRQES